MFHTVLVVVAGGTVVVATAGVPTKLPPFGRSSKLGWHPDRESAASQNSSGTGTTSRKKTIHPFRRTSRLVSLPGAYHRSSLESL